MWNRKLKDDLLCGGSLHGILHFDIFWGYHLKCLTGKPLNPHSNSVSMLKWTWDKAWLDCWAYQENNQNIHFQGGEGKVVYSGMSLTYWLMFFISATSTLSQELDQPTPRGVQVFIPGILLCHPYTQEYAFIEFQELAPWWVLAPN